MILRHVITATLWMTSITGGSVLRTALLPRVMIAIPQRVLQASGSQKHSTDGTTAMPLPLVIFMNPYRLIKETGIFLRQTAVTAIAQWYQALLSMKLKTRKFSVHPVTEVLDI